jgi:uncharacterized metal-binding protein YceD (DUF177 family)
MRINKGQLSSNAKITLEEDVVFDQKRLENNDTLKNIKGCHVKALISDFDDLIHINFVIDTTLSLVCSYTCEIFDKKFHIVESIDISEDPTKDDGNVFINTKPVIDLDDYIYSIICCEVPINPIKPGAKRPKSGVDYNVSKEK